MNDQTPPPLPTIGHWRARTAVPTRVDVERGRLLDDRVPADGSDRVADGSRIEHVKDNALGAEPAQALRLLG